MTDTNAAVLDRELQKGAAELLLLPLLEPRPRHGYELSKLIATRSDDVVPNTSGLGALEQVTVAGGVGDPGVGQVGVDEPPPPPPPNC